MPQASSSVQQAPDRHISSPEQQTLPQTWLSRQQAPAIQRFPLSQQVVPQARAEEQQWPATQAWSLGQQAAPQDCDDGQLQTPEALQVRGGEQEPQLALSSQPSEPHVLPAQLRTHTRGFFGFLFFFFFFFFPTASIGDPSATPSAARAPVPRWPRPRRERRSVSARVNRSNCRSSMAAILSEVCPERKGALGAMLIRCWHVPPPSLIHIDDARGANVATALFHALAVQIRLDGPRHHSATIRRHIPPHSA